MPHDANGSQIAVGDKVAVRMNPGAAATVIAVDADPGYSNVDVRFVSACGHAVITTRVAAEEVLRANPEDIRAAGDPGKSAYCGYFAECGGKSLISGAPLPTWENQAPAIQQAWRAAAMAAINSTALVGIGR